MSLEKPIMDSVLEKAHTRFRRKKNGNNKGAEDSLGKITEGRERVCTQGPTRSRGYAGGSVARKMGC